ncbi:flagellar hook-length control protein FliK [Indiicoccus explosivorum]|uniref:flagellar hook-length control protein FliK n=1 Tax=Indiicoccus explosivorum TaxID=1917864 RepID=UPI0013900056|nr:flagellar hook-length control protein FliK [Indiicoccus explosivorum]
MNISLIVPQHTGKSTLVPTEMKKETGIAFGAVFSGIAAEKVQAEQDPAGVPAALAELAALLGSDSTSAEAEKELPEELSRIAAGLADQGDLEGITVAGLAAELKMEERQAAEQLSELTGTEVEPTDRLETAVAHILEAGEKLLAIAGKGTGTSTPIEAEALLFAVKVLKIAQKSAVKPVLSHTEESAMRDISLLLKELAHEAGGRAKAPMFSGAPFLVRPSASLAAAAQKTGEVSGERRQSESKPVHPAVKQQSVQVKGGGEGSTLKSSSEETQSSPLLHENRSGASIKPAEKQEPARQLPAQEFEKLLNRAKFGQANGASKLLIRLNPGHLGMIRLEIVQREGVSTVQLLASTAHGKEMLDSSLSQLKQAFLQQNVAVDRIEITQALQDASGKNRQQQSAGQEPQEQRENRNDPETEFNEFLLELEAENVWI